MNRHVFLLLGLLAFACSGCGDDGEGPPDAAATPADVMAADVDDRLAPSDSPAPLDGSPGVDAATELDVAPPLDATTDTVADEPSDANVEDVPALDASEDADRVDSADAPPPACFRCPETWLPSARGGCGPEVLLCAPDGGAAPGGCEGRDIGRPRAITLPNGAPVVAFHRRADGSIGGGWPEPTWRPVAGISACPTGWTRDGDVCDPALSTTCAAGTAALPAGLCTRTGEAACPSGPFAEAPVGVAAIYVRADAPREGADGTVDHPVTTLAEGLARVGPGGALLVGAGTYREALALTRSVALLGACSARVRIEPTAGESPSIDVAGVDVEVALRGVTVAGQRPALRVRDGASVSVRDATVTGAVGAALAVLGSGSSLRAEHVLVEGTRPQAGDPAGGHAVLVADGARFAGSALHCRDGRDAALRVQGGGSVASLADSVLAQTGARATTGDGAGVSVSGGATARLARCVVADSVGAGAAATGVGSLIALDDSTVQRTSARGDDAAGECVRVEGAASGALRRVYCDRPTGSGVLAQGRGAAVSAAEVVVRGARDAAGSPMYVGGFHAKDGAALRGTRVSADRSVGAGTIATAGGALDLEDVTVTHTRQRSGVSQGWGLFCEHATASVRRGFFDDNGQAGVSADFVDASVVIEDAIIRGTRSEVHYGSYPNGNGLTATLGGHITATRVLLLDNQTSGAIASQAGAYLRLRDAAIVGTIPQPDGVLGAGSAALLGGTVALEHVLIQGVNEVGIGAMFRSLDLTLPATLEGDDVLVVDVRPSSVRGFGMGCGASAGASIRLGRLAVDHVHGAGVFAAHFNFTDLGVALGSQVELDHLFTRDVVASSTALRPDGMLMPSGPRNSFGLYAGLQSLVRVGSATIDGAERAFAAEGTLRVGRGALANISGGVGLWSSTTSGVDRVPSAAAFCYGEAVAPAIEPAAMIGAVQLPIAPPPTGGM